MDRGGDDQTGELEPSYVEAREFLENKHVSGEVPIVVQYPWWVTLRVPLSIIGIAILLLRVALSGLAALQLRDQSRDHESEEIRTCRELLSAEITNRASATRAAMAVAQAAFNDGLIAVIDDAPEGVDPDVLREANAAIPIALEAERRAINARDAWDSAHNPLPCPVPVV